VEAGATEVVAFPYMLSPGKHSMGDIPRMVAAAAGSHPGIGHVVTPPFGVHEKLAEVILMRAELEAERGITADDACRCWNQDEKEGTCGNACRLRQATAGATPIAG
jgi:sirohydrochlorin ferrochelatase